MFNFLSDVHSCKRFDDIVGPEDMQHLQSVDHEGHKQPGYLDDVSM